MEGITCVSPDRGTLGGTGNFPGVYLLVGVVSLAHKVGRKTFFLAGTSSFWVWRAFVSDERCLYGSGSSRPWCRWRASSCRSASRQVQLCIALRRRRQLAQLAAGRVCPLRAVRVAQKGLTSGPPHRQGPCVLSYRGAGKYTKTEGRRFSLISEI